MILPKISVVMPVYNIREDWLREAIDSILNQTFKDFEFIIIDDGSTNNTPDVLAEYVKKDDRIVIIQGEHKGISNALNKGLRAARGEYVARMDGDDISLPDRFEKQIAFMENNKDVGICGTGMLLFPLNKRIIYKENIGILEVIAGSPIAHATVLMRNELIKYYNLYYDEKFKTSEDYELWSRAIKYVKMKNLTEILYKYRKNSEGNSENKQVLVYGQKAKQSLMSCVTPDENLQKKIYKVLDSYYGEKPSLIQRIFSCGNSWIMGKKYKTITILGIRFKLYCLEDNI